MRGKCGKKCGKKNLLDLCLWCLPNPVAKETNADVE